MMWKELVQVANRRRFAAEKAVIGLAVSGLFVGMAYGVIYEAPGGASHEQMAAVGRTIFWTAGKSLSVALSLVVLLVAAGIVVAEHVNRRLALLLVTPLGPASLITAKAVSVFLQAAAGLLVALPVFALLGIFGGVDRAMIYGMALFVVSNVWLYASMGMLASILSEKTTTAFMKAGGMCLAWNLLTPIFFLLQRWLRLAAAASDGWIYALSPVVAFMRFQESGELSYPLVFHVCANAATGIVLLGIGFLLFRPIARRLAAGARKRPWRLPGVLAKLRSRKPRSTRPGISRLFGAGFVGRELASWKPAKSVLSLAWFAVMYGFILLVSLATGEWPDLHGAADQQILFLFELMGFLLVLSVRAATSVARDKEARTLQGLLLTGASPGRVLFSKAFAILATQFPAILFLLAHLFYIRGLDVSRSSLRWLLLPGALLLAFLFSTMLGLYYSLSSKKTATAVTLTVLTWLLGAFPGLMAADALRKPWNEVTFPPWQILRLAGVPLAAFLLLFVMSRAKSKGLGAGLSLLSYVILCGCLFAANVYLGRPLVGALAGYSFASIRAGLLLPAGSFAAFGGDSQDIKFATMLAVVQACLFVWIVFVSLRSFEIQAKRA